MSQTKKEFFANVKLHASELEIHINDLHDRETNCCHQVTLDQQADMLWRAARFHEVRMLEAAIELSKYCKAKLDKEHQ